MQSPLRLALLGIVVLFGVAQLVPVDRSNPPVVREAPITPEVRPVFEKACFDCHSHATRWPWYASVAPVSWLVAYDVSHGREELNFSRWPKRTKTQLHKLEEMLELVNEDEMPLWYYLPLHPEAKLTDADKQEIEAWARGVRASLTPAELGVAEPATANEEAEHVHRE